ncbi:MAG: di-heme oxidoredictase family protein [Pseudomonadales bacterium]|nr:di-heme oxidoredictase family protein [Pseudomonadales bacterium]
MIRNALNDSLPRRRPGDRLLGPGLHRSAAGKLIPDFLGFSAVVLFCFGILPPPAYSQAPGVLSLEQRLVLATGRAVFEKVWVSAPSSTTASDGLGPLYNARSCGQCHPGGGTRRPTLERDDGRLGPALVLHLGEAASTSVYGEQIQGFAVPGLQAEARLSISYTEQDIQLPGGDELRLRTPHYRLEALTLGGLETGLGTSLRLAPVLNGVGLLELVPEAAILALADPDDGDGDGVSGRANWLPSASAQPVLGRFGWKAGQPDLERQTARALNLDIGIGNPLFPRPEGDCTAWQQDCLARPNGNSPRQDDPEASAVLLAQLLFYVRNIPAPGPGDVKADASVLPDPGAILFREIGCAACHHSEFVLNDGRRIRPYTDLLLHDMGPGLADHRVEVSASGMEWRTPPLWGLETGTDSGNYLHDGRAGSVTQAILWHGGEAEMAKKRFMQLSRPEREDLLEFLAGV